MAAGPKVLYEFGPFQVDPDRQILLRENEPVAITPKAFETLLILVRRSREVVSKDELMKAVWPDSFVEEANLSQNIFRLRKALGDALGDQRYIVTLPGRGYRFAAQVRTVMLDGEEVLIASRTRSEMVVEQVEETASGTGLAAGVRLTGKVRWNYRLAGGAVPVLLAVSSVLILMLLHRPRAPMALAEKNSILIADFTNTTGDPVFDGTLRRGVAEQLEQSLFLSVVSDDRVQQVLRLMGLPPDARLAAGIARDVCTRAAADTVLEGSIARLGSEYVLGLQATDCRSGKVVVEQQVQAARKEEVLNALSRMASSFRTKVGESSAALSNHDTPLAEATTSSLEALKTYSAGWNAHNTTGSASALPFFKRAVEIDPTFAMAYAALGRMYGNLGESELSAESTAKAYQLRERASDREKFFITTSYDTQVTGNLEKAQETCEAWAQTYPREITPHAYLSGFLYPSSARYERALEESGTMIALDPDFAVGYTNRGYAYLDLDQPGEAESTLRRASDRKLEVSEFALLRYDLAFLKDDRAGMKREASLALGNSGAEGWIAGREAFSLAYTGQVREARRMSKRAADLAQQAGHPERAALFLAGRSVWEAFSGSNVEARKSALAALELSRDREVVYGAAFALAMAGDSSQSESLTNDLERRFPEDTSVKFSYVPTLRAMLAVDHGQGVRALELLQTAVPYELGSQRSSIHGNFGALYPIYVRGEAYLAARRGRAAAAEFQKILDHRGIVSSDPVGALARLQLGRAFALWGDMGKAKAAYQDLLFLWKDADSDLPVLKRAKAEYARVQLVNRSRQ